MRKVWLKCSDCGGCGSVNNFEKICGTCGGSGQVVKYFEEEVDIMSRFYKCDWCGKTFMRNDSTAKNTCHFCSRKCEVEYR